MSKNNVKNNSKNNGFRKLYIIPIVCIGLGVFILLYNFIALRMADLNQTRVVINYENSIANKSEKEIKDIKNKSKDFNDNLNAPIVIDKNKDVVPKNTKQKIVFKYNEMEGYITIPKINVVLPIFEGQSELSLSRGLGHISSSSLPIGGKGTHCVLAGHNSLSNTIIFDDLDKMKIGDDFYIKILDETHTYKVDKIEVVKTKDADEKIQIVKDKDYVTLVTCTPKTINTHRLLVRGERVPEKANNDKHSKDFANQKNNNTNTIVVLLIILAGIVVLSVVVLSVRLFIHRKTKS